MWERDKEQIVPHNVTDYQYKLDNTLCHGFLIHWGSAMLIVTVIAQNRHNRKQVKLNGTFTSMHLK